MWCKINNLMWGILKSEYIYIYIYKVGYYAKINKVFCMSWYKCSNVVRNNSVLCLYLC